jgi:NADH:ubiquinone oxidoreductase subunit K
MKQTKTITTPKKATAAGMGNLFEKDNLVWMLIGLGVMAVGFLLMAGGRSNDPNVFDKTQVYGTVRITIAPIIILAGLAIEIIAIFRRPKTIS